MSGPAEPAVPRLGAPGRPCHACDGPLAADQRYCLECGARRGAGGPIDFGGLLTAPRHAGVSVQHARSLRALRAPVPVAATMVLALLITGILLGSLTSSPTLAQNAGRPIDIVAPSPAGTGAPAPARVSPIVPVPAPVTPPPVQIPADPPATAPPPVVAQAPAESGSTPPSDGGSGGGEQTTPAGSNPDARTAAKPPVKHVFVIRLGEQSVARPFAASPAAPYLAKKLVPAGTLLPNLRTVAGSGLADAIALLSGQAPNAQTLAGCATYGDIAPGTISKGGQEQGEGCVYSVQTATLANQLDQQSLRWRAYLEDQAGGGKDVAACRHPAVGAEDPWREPRPGDAYITARNPFVYFHAITDSPGCKTGVVDLSKLDADLAGKAADVPALSYIVPSACHDGRAEPCAPGSPAGLAAADAFLAKLVPKIMRSKAYADALVIVTFDRAFAPAGANAAAEGGRVGALLLSPFVHKGRTIAVAYDTYSLLASIEDIFGLERLGRAAGPKVRPLGPGVFTKP